MVAIGVVATATKAIDPSQGALAVDAYLRIASMTIIAYDYLFTLPAELRLYKTTSRCSLGFILYVLMRYLSIVLITATNVGYFNHGFSPKACDHYFHIGPIFKVFQVMVSHAILGVRAYNIAQRNVWIGHALVLTYIAVVVVEWYSAVHNRIPLTMNGNCTVGSPNPHNPISAWSFYMAAMLYDFLALSISTYYLLKAKAAARAAASAASNLMKILLYDGLGYFVALTAVNMANIFLYRGNNYFIQTSGVSIGYAITSIMSQRIIIHARGKGETVFSRCIAAKATDVEHKDVIHELWRSDHNRNHG